MRLIQRSRGFAVPKGLHFGMFDTRAVETTFGMEWSYLAASYRSGDVGKEGIWVVRFGNDNHEIDIAGTEN